MTIRFIYITKDATAATKDATAATKDANAAYEAVFIHKPPKITLLIE